MIWKDLGNPYPRSEPRPYTPIVWSETGVVKFGNDYVEKHYSLRGLATSSFSSLIEKRRTRYEFNALSMRDLGILFSLTCKVRVTAISQMGFLLSRRPTPSAGAIHPIHVVVHLPGSQVLHRYDPFTHALVELACEIDTATLRRELNEIVDGGDGVLLLFVAEPGLTNAKYADAQSLVWRDAGILQGYFSMAAEALGLNFAPLGVTGEPWASRLVSQTGLAGVGVAYVGTGWVPPLLSTKTSYDA